MKLLVIFILRQKKFDTFHFWSRSDRYTCFCAYQLINCQYYNYLVWGEWVGDVGV